MLPGDAPTSPLKITDRIVIALDQLRTARDCRHTTRCNCASQEWGWGEMLDKLLDRYIEGVR